VVLEALVPPISKGAGITAKIKRSLLSAQAMLRSRAHSISIGDAICMFAGSCTWVATWVLVSTTKGYDMTPAGFVTSNRVARWFPSGAQVVNPGRVGAMT